MKVREPVLNFVGSQRGRARSGRRRLLRASSIGYLLVLATPAWAASFDCAKAHAPDEIAICGNSVLSELDTEMGALWFSYSKVPMMMGSNGARHDDAEQFLAQRAACKADVTCLIGVYRTRNTALRADIVEAMAAIFREENR
jgi:uncharacterized protein